MRRRRKNPCACNACHDSQKKVQNNAKTVGVRAPVRMRVRVRVRMRGMLAY